MSRLEQVSEVLTNIQVNLPEAVDTFASMVKATQFAGYLLSLTSAGLNSIGIDVNPEVVMQLIEGVQNIEHLEILLQFLAGSGINLQEFGEVAILADAQIQVQCNDIDDALSHFQETLNSDDTLHQSTIRNSIVRLDCINIDGTTYSSLPFKDLTNLQESINNIDSNISIDLSSYTPDENSEYYLITETSANNSQQTQVTHHLVKVTPPNGQSESFLTEIIASSNPQQLETATLAVEAQPTEAAPQSSNLLVTETELPKPETTNTSQNDASNQYTVVTGDTLFNIAKEHGTTVDALVEANDITNPDQIKIGETIVIPEADSIASPAGLDTTTTTLAPEAPENLNISETTSDSINTGTSEVPPTELVPTTETNPNTGFFRNLIKSFIGNRGTEIEVVDTTTTETEILPEPESTEGSEPRDGGFFAPLSIGILLIGVYLSRNVLINTFLKRTK